MSCKLFLVPEDVIQNWKSEMRAKQVDAPKETTLNNIDNSMHNVLNNNKLNDYEKDKIYTQKLGSYVSMRDNQNRQTRPVKNWPIDTIDSIPKKYQTKGKALMQYIQSDKDIQWDELGQMSLKGNLIEKSNIIDLLHDSLRARKTSQKPKGWKELCRHFHSRNIPQELLGNDQWKSQDNNKDDQQKDISVTSLPSLSTPSAPSANRKRYWGQYSPPPLRKSEIVKSKKKRFIYTDNKAKQPPRKSKSVAENRIKKWISLTE